MRPRWGPHFSKRYAISKGLNLPNMAAGGGPRVAGDSQGWQGVTRGGPRVAGDGWEWPGVA